MRLLEVAGNRWRTQIVADLRKVMKLNRHHSLFKQGRIGESLAEHRAIMQAIAARDGKRAAGLMRSALPKRAGSGFGLSALSPPGAPIRLSGRCRAGDCFDFRPRGAPRSNTSRRALRVSPIGRPAAFEDDLLLISIRLRCATSAS